MTSADIIEFPRRAPRRVSARADTGVERPLSPAELELAHMLHGHLDLASLLERFLVEARLTQPALEGICYAPPDSGESFVAGRRSARSLRSRLHFGGEYLGQLEAQVLDDLRVPLPVLLAPLASPLRNALHHHRVKLLARKDSLTGLGNRLALEATLDTETARAQRFGDSFSLLIADIDHFKLVNDTLGHSFGDQVIRSVAAQIRSCLRPYDQAFRYGGEEFVVVLSQTGLGKALQIAERIRKRVAQRCHAGATEQCVTISIGIGEIRHDESIDSLFDRTDRALYRAKNEGRNRSLAAS